MPYIERPKSCLMVKKNQYLKGLGNTGGGDIRELVPSPPGNS